MYPGHLNSQIMTISYLVTCEKEEHFPSCTLCNFLKERQTLVLCQILRVIWMLKDPPLGYEGHPAALKGTEGVAFQFMPNLSPFVYYPKHLSVLWSTY